MASNPWTKFFWSDYENDPELRLCSLAAQGLWMRLLCLAAKASPTGYLVTAGRPLATADIAQLVGKPSSEVETLVIELERNGVFSRDRRGVVYNRRMVRDAKKAKTSQQNGKKGGNPTLCEQTDNRSRDNPPLNPWVNPGVKPHKPEAISQKENSRDRVLPETAGGNAAAKDVIDRLDRAIVDHFGVERARPYPNATDMVFARRWLDEGIGLDVCGAVFDAICARKAAAKAAPPGMLKYFDAAVRDAARSTAGTANGGRGYDPADPSQRRQAERHAERVKDLLGAGLPVADVVAGGDWGAMDEAAFQARKAEMTGGADA